MATKTSHDVDHDAYRLTARINLDAITQNWRQLETLANGTKAMPVLKADAYGHGIIEVAKALNHSGCDAIFTTSIQEAVDIAISCPSLKIAYFDGPSPKDEDKILEHNFISVVNSLDQLHCLAEICRKRQVRLPAILHIDTGMNRLGLGIDEIKAFGIHPDLEMIDWQVVMSHLAVADDPSDPMNAAQKNTFDAFLGDRPTALKSAKASLSATAGIMLGKDFHYDLTRPGIGLYGMAPDPDLTPHLINQLLPTITLSGRVLQIRSAPEGSTIGYGKSHHNKRDCRLATIGGGYADGITRQMSNNGGWSKAGLTAPIVGRVSMDVHVIDITDWPDDTLSVGDCVDFITNGQDVHEIAKKSGTIAHDVLTRLGLRAKRHYAGNIVKELDL